MKLSKKLVAFVSMLFTLLSIHLCYTYINEVAPKVPIKGGTVVEGVLGKINYLPYTSKKPLDEFYQKLLFNGCVKALPDSSGAIQYMDDLCEVSTKDYKNYFIKLTKELYWIDDKALSMDDVEFTYQTILKENIWKLNDLNSYSKIEISRDENDILKISFPKQSRDNILFFTNPLLPKHSLEGASLDTYLKVFAKQPIYISCAVLDLLKSHDTNFIVDVTQCKDLYPKIIQVKTFDDDNQAISYLQKSDSIVDYMLVDSDAQEKYKAIDNYYTGFYIPSSTLYTLFFNINTVSDSLRKHLSNILLTQNFDNLLYHKTIFTFNQQSGSNLRDLFANQSVSSSGTASGSLSTSFPFLPKNIRIFGKGKYKEYYLDEFRDKYLIQFKFDTKYDKVTIASNGPYEFTPDSYDAENKTCAYNLSLQFKNIKKGVNNYIVYGYLNGKQSKLLTMRVHYGIKPQSSPLVTKKTNYTFVYLDEPNSVKIVDTLKQFFKDQGVDQFISRSSYVNFTEFEGKLSSKSYDFVLLPLELGSKKDLSALFSDNILLNPSQYTNDRISQLLQNFTNGNKSTVNEILNLYQKIYPFTMLGSLKQKIYVKSSYIGKINGDYNSHSFRSRLMNELKTYDTVVLDPKILWNLDNILNFIKKKL